APPSPARTATNTSLTASPLAPEAEAPTALAPELAKLTALPMAEASPVAPVAPVAPETAGPPMAVAVPRMPVLVAWGFDVAAPELPEFPELPERALGLD